MDTTARYLEPYEFGGHNVLDNKALLEPVGAVKDLDRYGNLPRNRMQPLKARDDVGTVKTKDRRGDRRSGNARNAEGAQGRRGCAKPKGGGSRLGRPARG